MVIFQVGPCVVTVYVSRVFVMDLCLQHEEDALLVWRSKRERTAFRTQVILYITVMDFIHA